MSSCVATNLDALLEANCTALVVSNNVMATAQPPAGATGFQWYLDGVALPGQTGSTLNVSAGNYGPGLYTMTSTFSGECLMGSAPVVHIGTISRSTSSLE